MSMWQFQVAIEGYVKANKMSDPKKFESEEEKEDMFNWLMNMEIHETGVRTNHVYGWDGFAFELLRIVRFEV